MMKYMVSIILLAACYGLSQADQTSDTLRRDINRMKAVQVSYSAATQVKLNTKLNRTVFNTYTSVERITPTSSGQTLTLSRVGSSTYSTVQHLQDIFHSAGFVSGGAITDAGGATINVAAGNGLIRSTNSSTGQVLYFDWPASNGLAITADTIRYVGVEYNSGTPQVTVRTSMNWNYRTDFPLGRVVNEAGTLHILLDPQAVGDHASTMIQREYATMPLAYDMRTGGLILGETGTRNITLTVGALWDRLNRFAIPALNTSVSGSFDSYYQDGSGGFTRVATQAQWPNTQYDNGTGTLATMTAARFANLWFYIETDGAVVMLYGRAQYTTLAAALNDAEPATVPNRIMAHGRLVGRLTYQKSAGTAAEIASAFTTMLPSSGTSNHANLSNLDYASAAHTGFVPDTRTVNGSALSGDVTVTTITGNAGTATALATPRAINGVNFDGSAPITINAVDSTARALLAGSTGQAFSASKIDTETGGYLAGASGNILVGGTSSLIGTKFEVQGSLSAMPYIAVTTVDLTSAGTRAYTTANATQTQMQVYNGNVTGYKNLALQPEGGAVLVGAGSNIVYYCNGGTNAGLLGRGNAGPCSGGSWVATSLQLD